VFSVCVSNAHAPFLGARLLFGDLICGGVDRVSVGGCLRLTASHCAPREARHYEVRTAARTSPSIRYTAAPSLTLAEARKTAREVEARMGATHLVSIYDTATRQAVA